MRAGRGWAAALLGLPLAVGVLGVALLLAPGPWSVRSLPLLLLLFPLWIGTASLPFVFGSARRAWRVLGTATAVVYALLFALKDSPWGVASLPP